MKSKSEIYGALACKRLLVATNNAGKAKEFGELFGNGWTVLTLRDLPEKLETVEDGDSFAANARKKALEGSEKFDGIVLADDSGLEVDVLDGAPGIYSARYSGEPKSDLRNNEKLLDALKEVPDPRRGAQFHCALALAGRGEILAEFEGICRGHILHSARGGHGFGYDPLFQAEGFDRSFAEMGSDEKHRISHRGKAMEKLREWLELTPGP